MPKVLSATEAANASLKTRKTFEVDLDKVRKKSPTACYVPTHGSRPEKPPCATSNRPSRSSGRPRRCLTRDRSSTRRTTPGHIFCSFLALLLRKELFSRLDRASIEVEWKNLSGDALTAIGIIQDDKRFVVRSRTGSADGKIFQCVGVKSLNTIRWASAEAACLARASENVVPRLSALPVTC